MNSFDAFVIKGFTVPYLVFILRKSMRKANLSNYVLEIKKKYYSSLKAVMINNNFIFCTF